MRYIGKVRDLSVELISLHDHALSLSNTLRAAGVRADRGLQPTWEGGGEGCRRTGGHEKPSSNTTKAATAVVAASTTGYDCIDHHNLSPSSSSVRPHDADHELSALLQSKSHPRLARLIRARREDPENFARSLSCNAIATAIGCERPTGDRGDGGGGGCGSHGFAARTRPQSAGANPSSSRRFRAGPASTSALSRLGHSHSCLQRQRRDEKVSAGEQPKRGRNGTHGARPTSAPARRSPPCRSIEREQRCRESGDHEGEGVGYNGVERETREGLVANGWSSHDEICRDAAELPKESLLYLIRTLRERLEGNCVERSDLERREVRLLTANGNGHANSSSKK